MITDSQMVVVVGEQLNVAVYMINGQPVATQNLNPALYGLEDFIDTAGEHHSEYR